MTNVEIDEVGSVNGEHMRAQNVAAMLAYPN